MSIERELRAYEALQALLKQAEACRTSFDEANLAYPEPLRRVLGIGVVNAPSGHEGPTLRIGPPSSHTRPNSVPADWLAVPLGNIMVQTGIVAILRMHGALHASSIVERFSRLKIEANTGSIANAGARLETQGIIQRSKEDGWSLVDASHAPVLNDSYVWGPKEAFTKQELAARRREAIRHLLGQFSSGLQNTQILERLEGLEWLSTPLSKDLVKIDMEEMQREGLVRRIGNSRKWVLTEDAA